MKRLSQIKQEAEKTKAFRNKNNQRTKKRVLEEKKKVKSEKLVTKISLNYEGVLLKAKRRFCCDPRKINTVGVDVGKKRAQYEISEIYQGEIVLFIGCWHYPIKGLFDNSLHHKTVKKLFNKSNRGGMRHLTKSDIMNTRWITSVRFLKNETIVKVSWSGIPRLDQLFQASKFMYGNFILA